MVNYEPIYIWEIYVPVKCEPKFWQACHLLGWTRDDNFYFNDYTYLAGKGLCANFTYDATDAEHLEMLHMLQRLNCMADGWMLDEIDMEE